MTPEQNIIFDELEQKAQGKVAALLGHLTRMEGAAELATALPKIIGPVDALRRLTTMYLKACLCSG